MDLSWVSVQYYNFLAEVWIAIPRTSSKCLKQPQKRMLGKSCLFGQSLSKHLVI